MLLFGVTPDRSLLPALAQNPSHTPDPKADPHPNHNPNPNLTLTLALA